MGLRRIHLVPYLIYYWFAFQQAGFLYGTGRGTDPLKTVAARGPVNGRGPRRSRGRDLVFKGSVPIPDFFVKIL